MFEGIIDTRFKQYWEDLINEIIRAYAVPVTLYFLGTKAESCPICLGSGPSSPNPYITGSRPNPNCTLCKGAGKVFPETTSTLNLAVVTDYKKFINVGTNVQVVDGLIQIVCKAEYLYDLKKCAYLIINSNKENLNKERFVRYSEPELHGMGTQSHIISEWKAS